LSFSEAFAHPQLSNNFNLLDGNADGLLSRAEVAAIVR
jgi:Ca2+-binding EF-hand superfamily protein